MTTERIKTLVRVVLDSSVSNTWDTAVLEWTVVDLEEDPSGRGVCVCGQPNLVEMFTIRNVHNGSHLQPIGNVCVRQFGRNDLNRQVDLFSELHTLRKEIPTGEVTLTSEYFSRALLEHLYSKGAFTPDRWNDYDGENDYEFLLDMFNKRNKNAITSGQQRKISVLLRNKVFPFVLAGD